MMHKFFHDGQEMAYKVLGDSASDIVVIWAHGWGVTHTTLLNLATPFTAQACHIMVDFPGFGASPAPASVWAPKDYAVFMAHFLRSLPQEKVLWVGHSFGCRVGVNLAAENPELVSSLCMIAGAGLPRLRSPAQKLSHFLRVRFYKFLKACIPFGISEEWLKSRFGSADYKQAGAMRNILVATVNEHLTDVALNVQCPATLIYGSQDTATPPSMGLQYNQLIPSSKLVVLEGHDHYTVINEGRHQVATHLKPLIQSLKSL